MPKLPLYHTSRKKSIEKLKSATSNADKSIDTLNSDNMAATTTACSSPASQVVTEKTTKIVEISEKTTESNVNQPTSSVENSNNPVDKSSKNVQNSSKNVEKSTNSVENSVDNANDSEQNSVDNPAENSQNKPKNTPNEPNPKNKDNRKTVIKVTNLRKSFRLPTEHASGLKQAIFNWLKGIKGYTEHQVLRGIDFEIKEGEFVGIIGRNGSGKSTLLKLLAQIYTPEQGTIEVDGTLVPFIELGVGFNPELTGRENVYLNGALLGFSNKEMDAMYDEIVNFAELEQFMDAKLKNYSSGMQVRLAFSIAIRARGDILILDEVLAVGDAAFQTKCNDYFSSLHGNQTVILVTHSMENVRNFCDRAILIEDGKIAAEGLPEDVAQAYEDLWNNR